MTFTLADLRKTKTDFGNITKALQKSAEGKGNNDDGEFFKLERDKTGNASAVIRFLPKHPDDELPWVTLYTHGFQGPTGRWYIENCLSTIGQDDPVNERNRVLWKGSEADKEQARKQKRKTSYIANILVVKNPNDPSLEGKVMRFKFGKKIYEKIMDKASPQFAEDTPVNVFDPFEGADFRLRMRTVEGYPNYDASTFADPSPIASSDEEILAVLNQMKPLNEIIDPKNFKSYDELKRKFDSVMNERVQTPSPAKAELMENEPVAAPAPIASIAPEPSSKAAPAAWEEDEEEDIKDYFAKLGA